MGITYNASIVRSGLVLYLDAANRKSYPGTGTTWTDLSGNENNGTLINGPTYSSANGGTLVFDGLDDYVNNSSTTNIPVSNSNRTIQIWVYPTTDTNCFVQLGTGGGGNQVYIFQFFNISNAVYLFTDGINSSNNLIISGSTLPDLNKWNHLIFGNSGQNWFYYKNAILERSGTWPTTINTVGQRYVIGDRTDVSATNVAGNISQVSIYNRALSPAEIRQNFEAHRDRYGI